MSTCGSISAKRLAAVHKRCPHKFVKNWPPAPLSALAQPPPPSLPPLFMQTPMNFENPKFFVLKSADVRIWRTPLPKKCPHWTTPLTADDFYGQPLIYRLDLFWHVFTNKLKSPIQPLVRARVSAKIFDDEARHWCYEKTEKRPRVERGTRGVFWNQAFTKCSE